MVPFQAVTIWLTYFLTVLIQLTNALNCDKEFTYFENYGQNGFNVSCNDITHGYEHMLENITISNEIALTLTNSTLENVTSNIFNRLGKIKTLSIVNSKFNYSRNEPIFMKLKRLETLGIVDTYFDIFEATFKDLSKLKYLVLSNNSLSKIQKNSFKSLERLEKLEVTENKIANIEDLNLCELPNVKFLSLRSNSISNSRLFSFVCQKSSNSLDFTINSNTKVLPVFSKGSYFNISDNAWNLIDLDLSSNQILELGHLLDGLTKLVRLNLSYNRISSIKFASFTSEIRLEKLVLAHNLINEVDPEVFHNKINLKHLDISYNNLNYFNISNLQKLEFLDLGHNNLKNVYMKNLTNLNSLNLDCNNLSNLQPLFFRKVPNLVTLQLCGNKIVLKRNFFKEVPKLESLILKNNSLSFLPEYAFYGLKNLKVLDLSLNNISSLSNGAFSDLSNLEELNLSRNALENFNYNIVQPLRSLNTLDLTNNKLKTFEYDIILSNLKGLSTVYIRENFLTCDVLEKMISFVKKRGISFTVSESMEYNSENVAGIPCVDPVLKPAPILITEQPGTGNGAIVNLGIAVGTIFILLLIGIISYRTYIFLKRRMYKADEFELING